MACADQADKLVCSICLNIYEDLIRMRCGHSLCRECIDDVPDTPEGSGGHTCPECRVQERSAFLKKPPLNEGNGIFCTDCTFSPLPAVISCMNCDASLCENHLRVHSKSEEHVFTKLNFTSTHKKTCTDYCSEDAACICVTRSLSEEHRGHQVETLTEASDKKKEKLGDVLEKLAKNKKASEERIENLQKYLRKAQEKACGVTESVHCFETPEDSWMP